MCAIPICSLRRYRLTRRTGLSCVIAVFACCEVLFHIRRRRMFASLLFLEVLHALHQVVWTMIIW